MNLFLALLVSLPAFSAVPASQAVVEDIFTKASAPEIASSLEKQKEVNAMVDFDALAKAALGKQAKAIPAKEFQWFRDTLKEIISRTVYPKAPDFLKGVKITYDSVKEKGQKAVVSSSVQNKADLTDVQYELEKAGDGWKVVDVSISGLSWVESINDQVKEVVRKKKWKGLKDAMNRRLNELKAGKTT
jgi:phospholipid transport system substrate-binding protein